MSLRLKFGILLLSTSLTYAQEVNYENQTYIVKGDKILQSGVDITRMLTIEKRETIQRRASNSGFNIFKRTKKRKVITPNKKSKEKPVTLINLKKTSKNFKSEKKPAALSNVEKASKNLKEAYNSYGALKRSGTISRSEETKWLEKIEKLKAKLARARDKDK